MKVDAFVPSSDGVRVLTDCSRVEGPHLHVVEIQHGSKFFRLFHHNEEDHIFRQIKTTGTFYEPNLLASLGTRLRPDDVVIDVGANIGNHTVYFAGVCGCRVVAFEPNPSAARLLRAAVSQNGLSGQVEVREMALGRSESLGRLDESSAAGNLGAVGVVVDEGGSVPIHTLDSQKLPGPPRVIKIDAEGMEEDVLRGANKILRQRRPTVSVEAKTTTEFGAVAAILVSHKLLPVETHNYSPTHIFVSRAREGGTSVLNAIALQGGRNYVRSAQLRVEMLSKLQNIEAQNRRLETRILELELLLAEKSFR